MKLFKINFSTDRIYGLDILRAFAIIFVMIGHSKAVAPIKYKQILNFLTFDGVTIFFVLSGFLIGKILINVFNESNNKKILLNFWIRRWFRTLPNYFLILIILLSLGYFFQDNFDVRNYDRFFVFSQNIFSIHPVFFVEAWSLSVEEWFYLIIPILLFLLNKKIKLPLDKSILIIAFSIIILVTLYRYNRFVRLNEIYLFEWDHIFRKQVSTRIDSIMFGVIGAFISYYYNNIWIKYKVSLLILGISLMVFSNFYLKLSDNYNDLFICVFLFTIYSISTLFLIPFLSTLKKGKGFIYNVLTIISLISYSMYLINYTLVQHWIIFKINWKLLFNNQYIITVTRYSAFWILTILLSILIYKYFEVPITKLRDYKIFKREEFNQTASCSKNQNYRKIN